MFRICMRMNTAWYNKIHANIRRATNAGLVLAHRLWRWANISPALILRLVITGLRRKYLKWIDLKSQNGGGSVSSGVVRKGGGDIASDKDH